MLKYICWGQDKVTGTRGTPMGVIASCAFNAAQMFSKNNTLSRFIFVDSGDSRVIYPRTWL